MNMLFCNPTVPVRIEPPTRQFRRRKLTVEPLESRALLSIGYAAPSYSVVPTMSTAESSPAAMFAPVAWPTISDSGEVDLRHAVAD
jgi:hypothetical protein